MGTRHLILVYYKGAYQIAQYGQWDGYPSGQGVIVLAFVRDSANLVKLKEALDMPGRIFEPTKEMLAEWNKESHADQQKYYQEMRNADSVLDRPEPRRPSISRDTGAKILGLVANATEPVPILKEVEFIADTLFCEWAYVVDLDKDVPEVYAGSWARDGDRQTRFGDEEGVASESTGPALMGKWSFNALPDEESFLLIGESSENEE